jgi:hypothetical protein
VLRRVWADNPDDLNSPLHVETTTTVAVDARATTADDLSPAAKKLIEAMRSIGTFTTSALLVDWIATKHGHGLTRQTVSTTLNDLEERGLATSHGASGKAKLWALADGVSGVGMVSA